MFLGDCTPSCGERERDPCWRPLGLDEMTSFGLGEVYIKVWIGSCSCCSLMELYGK